MARAPLASRPQGWHPLGPGAPFCRVVPGFLSAAECRAHIEASEERGFAGAASDYPPSYRNNDRLVWDHPALAEAMFERMRPHAPPLLPSMPGESAGSWALDGINERFRFCRYNAGQAFHLHQDGVCHRGRDLRSCLTFMVYLTDGDAFEGGDTVFYDSGPGVPAPRVEGRVRPRAGMLILFDHRLWHAGEAVTRGCKHLLRSDVFYRRTQPPPEPAAAPFTPPHQGYVWTLAETGTGLVASGGRDGSVRLWDAAGQGRGVLSGHTRSVLGLAPLPGRRLVSVSRDRSLRLWNLEDLSCLQQVRAHEAACLCVCSIGGGAVATAGADGLIKLWSPAFGPLAVLQGHAGWVWALARDEDGLLASASEDGCVKLWNLAARSPVYTLAGSIPLRTLACGPGLLATGDIEGGVCLWRGKAVAARFKAHAAAVRRVRFLDGDTLATAGEDGWVRVWRLGDQRRLAETRHGNFATDLLHLPDGRLLSCSYDGEIRAHSLLDCAV